MNKTFRRINNSMSVVLNLWDDVSLSLYFFRFFCVQSRESQQIAYKPNFQCRFCCLSSPIPFVISFDSNHSVYLQSCQNSSLALYKISATQEDVQLFEQTLENLAFCSGEQNLYHRKILSVANDFRSEFFTGDVFMGTKNSGEISKITDGLKTGIFLFLLTTSDPRFVYN